MTEPTIVLPPHSSYSQAASMQTCGWRWFLERGLRVPQRPSWATVAGGAVHKATEWWDNWTLSDRWEMDTTVIDQLFHNAFDEEIEERLKQEPDYTKDEWRASGRRSAKWPDKENEAYWRAEGPAHVRSWVTWRTNNPQWEIVNLETVVGIELDVKAEIGGVAVRGFIDRLFHRNESELLVLDLKSGAREPDSADQLGTYRVLLEETYGISPTWGTYWMSRTGSTTAFEDLSLWPKERLDYTYRSVRAQQERAEFLAKKTNMCSGCSVRDYCFAVNGAQSDTIPLPWEVTVALPDVSS